MIDKIKNNINNIKEVTCIRADYELMDIDYIDKEGKERTITGGDEYDVLYYIQYLQKEIERLNKEVEKYKNRCFKGLKLIRDNYGVLDKYGIDILDDILNGVDKE